MPKKGKGNIQAQKARYKLKHPDKIAEAKKRYRKRHPDVILKATKKYNLSNRANILKKYSGEKPVCLMCGESNQEFLEIVGLWSDVDKTSNELYAYLKASGYPNGYVVLCSNCNLKRIREYSRCTKGVGGTPNQKKWYYRDLKIRLDILEHYKIDNQIKCVCCGESDIDALCMDHKNGDGNEHRKIISSSSMYRWIQKNHYPDMFQILCANCNQAYGKFGYCPHKSNHTKIDPKLVQNQSMNPLTS